jgi:multidrug efflux pump subunit AcrA (membrane-fusion protein)
MRLARQRIIFGVAGAAIVAGAGAFVWVRHGGPGVRYRTSAATLGSVTQTVSLSGNLTPVGETDISFATSGRVTSVAVSAGQQVSAGQLLATLDTAAMDNTLAVARANLSSAQARLSLDRAGPTAQSLASAQAQVDSAAAGLRNDETAYDDTVSVDTASVAQAQDAYNACTVAAASSGTTQWDDWQTAKARAQQANDQASGQVAMARVQLQSAQAALQALEEGSTPQQIQMDESQVQIDELAVSSAQSTLDAATLRAPVAGVVASVNVAAGDTEGGTGAGSSSSSTSSGSGSGSGGAAAVSIITPGAFQVTGSISDALVDEVTDGQKAQVTVAGSSQAQPGTVTAVAPEATISSGVATFAVTVTLDAPDPSLRDGMSASVNVIVNQVVGVLTVPTSAVHTTAAGSTVTVLVDGRARQAAVQVGASDALRTQIVSGLAAGEQVVIATVSASVPTNAGAGGLFGGFGGRGGGGRGGGGQVVAPGG